MASRISEGRLPVRDFSVLLVVKSRYQMTLHFNTEESCLSEWWKKASLWEKPLTRYVRRMVYFPVASCTPVLLSGVFDFPQLPSNALTKPLLRNVRASSIQAHSEPGKYVEWPKSRLQRLSLFYARTTRLCLASETKKQLSVLRYLMTSPPGVPGNSRDKRRRKVIFCPSWPFAIVGNATSRTRPPSRFCATHRRNHGYPVPLRIRFGRIHDMLRTVAASDERIPRHVRSKMLANLGKSLSADRAADAEEILQALTAMGSLSREIFILAIDQAGRSFNPP